jgi:hypothetical protein
MAGTLLFTDSFQNDSAPGWTFRGDASLTGGTSDPNGQGWLRLTNNAGNQSSFVYEAADIPFLYGVDIKLSFVIWGGTGADGIAVDLIDGATSVLQPGSYGGSLGYAQRTSPTAQPGLAGGILGIAVDRYGNFSNPTEGRAGGTARTANSIAIRGPGDGTSNATTSTGRPNYAYLTGNAASSGLQTGANGTTTRPANYYDAEFIIGTQLVSEGRLPISVLLTNSSGTTTTVIDNYDAYNSLVSFYGGTANLPETMNLGFSAGTGAQYDYHEIRNLSIASIDDIPASTPEPAAATLAICGASFIFAGSFWGRRRRRKAVQVRTEE